MAMEMLKSKAFPGGIAACNHLTISSIIDIIENVMVQAFSILNGR